MSSSEHQRDPSRREVLLWAGGSAAASAFWLPLTGCDAPPRQSPTACAEPVTEVERTLAAFVDAVVPGYESDPRGAPGALDACGLNVLLDPASPFEAAPDLLAAALDEAARETRESAFSELDLAAREEVLASAAHEQPDLILAIRFVRFSFYAAVYDDLAERWLGVLSPSLDHVDDGFGFDEPQCDEMTDAGNLP